jgi:hypothetical protein
MTTRKPRAYVTNIFSETPIAVVTEGFLTLPTAKKLLLDLSAAVAKVDAYYQCGLMRDGALRKWRCPSRGSVRIGEAFYCKVHARQIARKAKVAE